MDTINPDLKKLYYKFKCSGTLSHAARFGSGHIHTTWLLRTSGPEEPDYILQRINHHVFKDVEGMMANIEKVTSHLGKKSAGNSRIEEMGERVNNSGDGKDGRYKQLELVKTIANDSFFYDPDGNYWRMYVRVVPGISHDIATGEKLAWEAGRAFGSFIADLSDLPAEELIPVLPGFHSMSRRYRQLADAVAKDIAGRAGTAKKELAYIGESDRQMLDLERLAADGVLPARITHNDTKLNNLLFDDDGRAICVIDLDTVMPGLSLYDFGDAVRTIANMAEEDEVEIEKITFDIPLFEAFSRGFVASTVHMLTEAERANLTLSAQYMTMIMAVRFLTDYLSGDVYYRIDDREHNIRRCRAQLRLLQDMRKKKSKSDRILQSLFDEKTRPGSMT